MVLSVVLLELVPVSLAVTGAVVPVSLSLVLVPVPVSVPVPVLAVSVTLASEADCEPALVVGAVLSVRPDLVFGLRDRLMTPELEPRESQPAQVGG